MALTTVSLCVSSMHKALRARPPGRTFVLTFVSYGVFYVLLVDIGGFYYLFVTVDKKVWLSFQ